MVNPDYIFGRLGNRMFQGAFLWAYAKDHETDIYFQDPKWFEGHEDEVRKLYSPGIHPRTDKVAIHVRRGDYVNNPFYVDLTETDYYEKAMAEFPDEQFLVFSDDIDWCREYFLGDEYEFDNSSEIDALNRMASCKGIIMANSSFSWWSAFLSTDAKVVAPKLWYSDGIERTKCLDSWIRK